MDFVIDPEFASENSCLSKEEFSFLEESLLTEGCRDPLVVWNGILIDGHNRYKICSKHGLPFEIVEREFPDRLSVLVWITKNQLGRRNLTDYQRAEKALRLEGLYREQARKRMLAGVKANPVENSPQGEEKGRTREALAELAGVSSNTLSKVKNIQLTSIPEVEEKLREGEISIHAGYQISRMPEEEQKEVLEEISKGEKPSEIVKKHVHVAQNSGENEWYTPSALLEMARDIMGSIDCDPASSEIANERVKAKIFFTKFQDGLTKKWEGNIWLNPPYAQPLIGQFAEAVSRKFESGEINQVMVLVNNATETKWFQRMGKVATFFCFLEGRVKFLDPSGNASGQPLQGQVLIYFGPNGNMFSELLSPYGLVLERKR